MENKNKGKFENHGDHENGDCCQMADSLAFF